MVTTIEQNNCEEDENMKIYQRKADFQRKFIMAMTIWNALVGLLIVVNIVLNWF